VKLSAGEIAGLRQAIASAGREWRGAVQGAFRRLLFARVVSYQTDGLAAALPYADRQDPTHLAAEFEALVDSSPYLARHAPAVVSHFDRYPAGSDEVESFLYWAKETLGGRTIVSLTHVAIARPEGRDAPEVLVASRPFYTTHYITGALALTAIVGGAEGAPRHLTYLNRSRVDVLGGLFGRLARAILERRLRSEATGVVEDLRRRLESGEPPPDGTRVQAPFWRPVEGREPVALAIRRPNDRTSSLRRE
jgi:hypothetical protein